MLQCLGKLRKLIIVDSRRSEAALIDSVELRQWCSFKEAQQSTEKETNKPDAEKRKSKVDLMHLLSYCRPLRAMALSPASLV